MPSGHAGGGRGGKMPMPKSARKIIFGGVKELKTRYQILFLIVISFAVIAFWRGAWGLLDEFFVILMPNDPRYGYWISFLAGITILAATGYASKELV